MLDQVVLDDAAQSCSRANSAFSGRFGDNLKESSGIVRDQFTDFQTAYLGAQIAAECLRVSMLWDAEMPSKLGNSAL